MSRQSVAVVVVAFGPEPLLEECLGSVGTQLQDGDRLIVVDNGPSAEVRSGRWLDAAQVVRPGVNLGFAAGANAGAAVASSDVLVFLNSDAIVRPGAVARLIEAVQLPEVGIVQGCLRLAEEPDMVNSSGNPVHFSGLAWAGGLGDHCELHAEDLAIPSASGGFFAIRSQVWEELKGFKPYYFAYHEDVDLSLRAWMSGYVVRYVHDAIADHHYEFSRNHMKMRWLERNRLITVLTLYPRRILLVLAPALVVVEVAILATSLNQGWLRDKLYGYAWILRHLKLIAKERRVVQSSLSRPPEHLVALLTGCIDPGRLERPAGMSILNRTLSSYWRLVTRLLSHDFTRM